MASRIPIQNIYYLLVYAWDRLAEGELVDVAGIDGTELVDLYAAVLLSGLRHLVRRGLDQTYLPVEAEIAGIRGRVQIAATARRMLAQHGRAQCLFDELSVDTLPNRILLSTAKLLLAAPNLSQSLREQLRAIARSLSSISDFHINKQAFSRVQLHRNNGFYRFLLSVCELIFDTSLSAEETGHYRFRDFIRDPARMAQLFERFAFNFFRIECPHSEVKRERILWVASSRDDPDLLFLPAMRTDITIRQPGRTLVIDAKFYEETLQRHFGSESIHSGHLYQIFSYLKNMESTGGQDAAAEGMLLYPTVERQLRLRYDVMGHTIRVCTLNLAQNWRDVRGELLSLVA